MNRKNFLAMLGLTLLSPVQAFANPPKNQPRELPFSPELSPALVLNEMKPGEFVGIGVQILVPFGVNHDHMHSELNKIQLRSVLDDLVKEAVFGKRMLVLYEISSPSNLPLVEYDLRWTDLTREGSSKEWPLESGAIRTAVGGFRQFAERIRHEGFQLVVTDRTLSVREIAEVRKIIRANSTIVISTAASSAAVTGATTGRGPQLDCFKYLGNWADRFLVVSADYTEPPHLVGKLATHLTPATLYGA